ncbi:efflux RND transporter periplasmic adaptor subunit [Candidatus Sumerlaeota bacterium]|nr:efflux RND transporter periplasmic adaptor subunit [Candidatus Sumerlaeota bacterium]
MKRLVNAVIILGFIALMAYVAILASAKNRSNNSRPKEVALARDESTQPTTSVVRVKVAVMRPQPMAEALLLPATVEAWEDIDLSAKAGGTVEWVGPKEGDRVTSGEVIIRLDTASRQAVLRQARASLAQAEKQYERISSLVREKVANQAELDNAIAQRDVARANFEVAEVALADATLRSPTSGVIDRIHVDRGEHVNQGQVVAKIVQTDRLKVLVNVPEKDVCFCKGGQPATVFCGDQITTEQMVIGKIGYVALTADPISRTFPMRIEIANQDGKLRPGMIVRAGLIRQQVADALAVPLYAVLDRGSHKAVFVEEDGKAVERRVELGIIDFRKSDRIQVTHGLSKGDRLIVVGHRDLAHGMSVEVEGTVEL